MTYNPTQTPTPSGIALRIMADSVIDGHTVGPWEALRGAGRAIAATPGRSILSAVPWTVGSALLLAVEFTDVDWQIIVLAGVGLVLSYIGLGLAGQYALLQAVDATPATRRVLIPTRLSLRYTAAEALIGAILVLIIGGLSMINEPLAGNLAIPLALVMAWLTLFAPINYALGDSVGDAFKNAAVAGGISRYIGLAVILTIGITLAEIIPFIALAIIPMRVAAIAYCRVRDPDVRRTPAVPDAITDAP